MSAENRNNKKGDFVFSKTALNEPIYLEDGPPVDVSG